jgi:hypothetical protein
MAGVEYKKAFVKVKERGLSGLVINPHHGKKKPIFLYMHGTRFKKSPTPSGFCDNLRESKEELTKLISFDWTIPELIQLLESMFGQGSKLLDYMEEIFLSMIAVLKDCIVIMPDYPGLGNDIEEAYPYVVAEDLQFYLSKFTEEVIQASSYINKKEWNQDLHIGGYSHGGYIAMVVTAELLKSSNLKDNIKKCWPAGGPYSLSKVMRKIMLSGDSYFTLSFLPLTIRGFYECCGKEEYLSPRFSFGENGDKIFDIANIIFQLLFLSTILYPFIYLISVSISDPSLVVRGKIWLLPKNISFESYSYVLKYNGSVNAAKASYAK